MKYISDDQPKSKLAKPKVNTITIENLVKTKDGKWKTTYSHTITKDSDELTDQEPE